jgi:hypothetical protein
MLQSGAPATDATISTSRVLWILTMVTAVARCLVISLLKPFRGKITGLNYRLIEVVLRMLIYWPRSIS